MDAFISRGRSRDLPTILDSPECLPTDKNKSDEEDESTDLKLATLASMHPNVDQVTLFELLISAEGSVKTVSKNLSASTGEPFPRKRPSGSIGHQSSLSKFTKPGNGTPEPPLAKRRLLTRKGQTLHLYNAEDIAAHTPCSIIHNFLPPQQAENLLKELLDEAVTFERQTFKLFDNVVQSPHSACFYVDSLEEQKRQRTEYLYNGSFLDV